MNENLITYSERDVNGRKKLISVFFSVFRIKEVAWEVENFFVKFWFAHFTSICRPKFDEKLLALPILWCFSRLIFHAWDWRTRLKWPRRCVSYIKAKMGNLWPSFSSFYFSRSGFHIFFNQFSAIEIHLFMSFE